MCWCVYLNALSQVFNDSHMLIEHRLQTEDFLAMWKNTKEKQLYFVFPVKIPQKSEII